MQGKRDAEQVEGKGLPTGANPVVLKSVIAHRSDLRSAKVRAALKNLNGGPIKTRQISMATGLSSSEAGKIIQAVSVEMGIARVKRKWVWI